MENSNCKANESVYEKIAGADVHEFITIVSTSREPLVASEEVQIH